MKISGLSLQHPFGQSVNIPVQIEESRLIELIKKLKNGEISKKEYDEIAKGYIRLGLSIASKYAAKWPTRKDDFISTAMFGIVKALSTAKEKLRDDNLTSLICAIIHNLCKKARHKFRMIAMSERTYKRHLDQNKEIVNYTPVPYNALITANYEQISEDDSKKQELNLLISKYHRHETKVSKSVSTVRDLKEILYLSCRDEIDRQIVDMRIEGYNDSEIAEQLFCSNSYINNRRHQIENRFDEMNH